MFHCTNCGKATNVVWEDCLTGNMVCYTCSEAAKKKLNTDKSLKPHPDVLCFERQADGSMKHISGAYFSVGRDGLKAHIPPKET